MSTNLTQSDAERSARKPTPRALGYLGKVGPGGYDAHPRWFFRSEFFQKLTPAHQGIVRFVYDRVYRGEPKKEKFSYVHGTTGKVVNRGQLVVTYGWLANRCNSSIAVTRRVIQKLKGAQAVAYDEFDYVSKGRARQALLLTWLDFDCYDIRELHPDVPARTPARTPARNKNTHPSLPMNQNPSSQGGDDADEVEAEVKALFEEDLKAEFQRIGLSPASWQKYIEEWPLLTADTLRWIGEQAQLGHGAAPGMWVKAIRELYPAFAERVKEINRTHNTVNETKIYETKIYDF